MRANSAAASATQGWPASAVGGEHHVHGPPPYVKETRQPRHPGPGGSLCQTTKVCESAGGAGLWRTYRPKTWKHATDSPPSSESSGPACCCCSWSATSSAPACTRSTGKVAGEVGGAVWLPFLVAFIVALLTALSYLELVTKYPQAAGAALYTHRAFGVHFLTFMVTFAVMCSGLTSASSASKAFAATSPRPSTCRIGEGAALTLARAGVHDADRAGQLPRRQRERQGERGADLCRADRPADRDRDRGVGARQRQGRHRPADGVQRPEGEQRLLSGAPPPRRWRSSPWWASRTR